MCEEPAHWLRRGRHRILCERASPCRAGNFAFAGTKDKRAITVQQVTAFRIPDSRLAYTNTKLRCGLPTCAAALCSRTQML